MILPGRRRGVPVGVEPKNCSFGLVVLAFAATKAAGGKARKRQRLFEYQNKG
jgi:hypothetical protein